ncbi:hypothetical protein [Streptomyces sp. NPDC052496]|uniref:hypothetical protein n=1 Tax=Streptomyces sp. NPDC052496 TaxID=3154951 RepID=UPI00343A5DAA
MRTRSSAVRAYASARLPSSAGRVVGAGLVLAGLFFGGMTAKDMGYANGHRGDAGTLTVQECRTQFDRVGSSRHRHARPVVTCTGTFRADRTGAVAEGGKAGGATAEGEKVGGAAAEGEKAGGATAEGATLDDGTVEDATVEDATVEDATVETEAKFEPGKHLAVQKTDHGFVMIDEQWIWRSLAIVGVSMCTVVAGVFCLLTGFGTRRGPALREAWRRVPGGAVVRAVLVGLGGLAALGPVRRCSSTGWSDAPAD